MTTNAIILAGAANTGALRDVSTAANEALIDIGNKPMVQYVVDALRQSIQIGRILLVGPTDLLRERVRGENLEFIPSRQRIVDNINAALEQLPPDEKVLIATCDIPLINGNIVDGFLGLCAQRDADLYYPVVEKSVNEQRFPHVKRTYVRLREGTFTGGNMFLVNPWIRARVTEKMNEFLKVRKNPLKMAGLLGWGFLWRLVTRRLSLQEAEAKASSFFGIRGAVIVCPFPEIGVDVDKPSDLQLAIAALSS